jgi:hypothetical protein
MYQFIDGAAEGACVCKQRRDIAKQNARLRMIRDRADRGAKIILQRHPNLLK